MIYAWYDELASFTKWWWATTALATFGYWRMGGAFHPGEPLIFRFSVVFSAGFCLLYVAVNALGLVRQKRAGRNVPAFLGVLSPAAFVFLVAPIAPELISKHPPIVLLAVGGACFATVMWLRATGRGVMQRVLASAPSMADWTEPHPPPDYTFELKDPLEAAAQLLSMDELHGAIREGRIHDFKAAAFSGSCTVTAIPHVVDAPSRIALAVDAFLSDDKKLTPELSSQSTSLFVTIVAVRLPSRGRFRSFDLRSRAWGDADVVFDNVRDRIEHFESIELDRHHDVRVPTKHEQLDAWASFSPNVIDALRGRRRMNIRKQGQILVGLRIGGCASSSELDDLVELVGWFAEHSQR